MIYRSFKLTQDHKAPYEWSWIDNDGVTRGGYKTDEEAADAVDAYLRTLRNVTSKESGD